MDAADVVLVGETERRAHSHLPTAHRAAASGRFNLTEEVLVEIAPARVARGRIRLVALVSLLMAVASCGTSPRPAVCNAGERKTEVVLLACIQDDHMTSQEYSFERLEQIIASVKPDVIPDRGAGGLVQGWRANPRARPTAFRPDKFHSVQVGPGRPATRPPSIV